MKKTIWSLAALMLMAAPMMTSCSNDLDEAAPAEEVKENVVTLTIKMPEQAQTRVGIDDGTLKLTGWEQDDVVKVYKIYVEMTTTVEGGIEFTCTDPSTGTFTGTLPAGKSLNDYNVAAYGHDIEAFPSKNRPGFVCNRVSTDLKDVIFLAGKISGGNCNMTIHNNVLKVTNNGPAVEVAWANDEGDVVNQLCLLDDYTDWGPMHGVVWDLAFNQCSFTIPAGVSYVMTAPLEGYWGLVDSEGNWVVPNKEFEDLVVGKLFKKTIDAPATGGEVDFTKAEFKTKVGTSSSFTIEKEGIEMAFSISPSSPRSPVPEFSISKAGLVSFSEIQENDIMTIDVRGGTITSVTNSATSKTLGGACPWTLTYKTSPSAGWYTSGGDAFIGENIPTIAKLTVVYE